jgi:signal transduction histidine kinase
MPEQFKVLLVEDSPDDAELVLRFVKKYNKDVHYRRVENEAGLREAYGCENWDLILSDYNLPVFSGLEAIRTLKELKSHVPLIIVSGTIGEETAVEALKAGATDYVLKSNLGRLPTAIEHAIRVKRAEVENRKLTRQLEQSQKMEAIGRLAGGIAHDVNNALAAMTIYAEEALRQVESSELAEAKESIKGILISQESAAGIVRQLLAFGRRNMVEDAKIVDLPKATEKLSPLIKTLMKGSCELKVDLPDEKIEVLADPSQIEQVIMNLAVNARDAMDTGGTFTLSVSLMHMDSHYSEARIPVAAGRYACLSARDTGCGMPADVLDKIFEPFFTTKEVGKGTGLGLAVIYGIVKQAQGTVLVDSQVGGGTEFRVLWPLAETQGREV